MVTAAGVFTPATSFVGRDAELAQLRADVSAHRLVTVVGPGGTGKTRLTLQLANELVRSAADVWVVELAPVSADTEVAWAVMERLGWRDTPAEAPEDLVAQVVEGLRPRKGVLILDNCEHVLEGAAALCRDLVRGCPDVNLVCTSREPLRVSGEAVWRLGPLLAPRSGERRPLEELLRMPSVQMLRDRARLHDRGFEVTEENADAIARICAAVDGLPLALELAAPWLRVLSAQDAAERIEENLDFLAAYEPTVPERHRSLLAALEWSYGLLAPEEQRLFTRLCVFVGGFSAEAAEAVCGGQGVEADEVIRLLARLVDTSLVVAEHRPGLTQYRLLETVRDFSERKLAAQDAPRGTEGVWTFHRDGDSWLVGPRPVRIPNAKGLGYIHELLLRAGDEVHALDLTGGIVESGTGTVLDAAARRAYRDRLADLRAEADEAASFNDLERAARAEREIDGIVNELAAAVGLGGRGRVIGSSAERARMSVTKAIRWAIQRIAQHDEAVARHLTAAVQTGTYCRYEGGEVSWKLAEP